MVSIFAYLKFPYPKIEWSKVIKIWVKYNQVILVWVAQKSSYTKMDLVISFSILNLWTKDQIKGNNNGYKGM